MPTTEEQIFLADVTKLKASVLAFAITMVSQHGEFYPFARTIDADGKMAAYDAASGNERVEAKEVYGRLKTALAAAARQGRLRAVGLCNDATLKATTGKVSAIRLLLEYHNGVALEVLVAYGKDPFGKYCFSPEQVQPAASEVFGVSGR